MRQAFDAVEVQLEDVSHVQLPRRRGNFRRRRHLVQMQADLPARLKLAIGPRLVVIAVQHAATVDSIRNRAAVAGDVRQHLVGADDRHGLGNEFALGAVVPRVVGIVERLAHVQARDVEGVLRVLFPREIVVRPEVPHAHDDREDAGDAGVPPGAQRAAGAARTAQAARERRGRLDQRGESQRSQRHREDDHHRNDAGRVGVPEAGQQMANRALHRRRNHVQAGGDGKRRHNPRAAAIGDRGHHAREDKQAESYLGRVIQVPREQDVLDGRRRRHVRVPHEIDDALHERRLVAGNPHGGNARRRCKRRNDAPGGFGGNVEAKRDAACQKHQVGGQKDAEREHDVGLSERQGAKAHDEQRHARSPALARGAFLEDSQKRSRRGGQQRQRDEIGKQRAERHEAPRIEREGHRAHGARHAGQRLIREQLPQQ